MASEEIINGLRNALQRGYSLEQAKQSFINAGFSREEVESAAASFSGAISQFPTQNKPQAPVAPKPQIPQQISMPTLSPGAPQPQAPMPQIKPLPSPVFQKAESGPSKGLIATLIIILVLLLGILAASFFFKEQILSLFK